MRSSLQRGSEKAEIMVVDMRTECNRKVRTHHYSADLGARWLFSGSKERLTKVNILELRC